MAIMLPDNLIWIMEKIGLEWPDINEDELHKGADLTRQFRDDLEALIQMVDNRIVNEAGPGLQGRSGEALVAAWNTNRSQNLQKLLDVLDPIAFGVDAAGVVVEGLKWKTIAQVTFNLATLIPMFAAGPFGAAAAAARMIAMKIALGITVDLAVTAAIDAVDDPVINALKEHIPAVMNAILDAPIVEDLGSEMQGIAFDLQVLQQTQSDMTQHAGDAEMLITQFLADIENLHITE